MVQKSLEYLDSMLEEYNEKVNSLEDADAARRMEAFVNRGCVLVMMGHHTSAMDDFETVLTLAEEIEESGGVPERDTVFKALTTMGLALYTEEQEFLPALEAAADMVQSLGRNVRHFDRRSMTRTCLDCADALMDEESYAPAEGFLGRVLGDTAGAIDDWSRNRHAEALLMSAECLEMMGDANVAIDVYTDAIEECKVLMMNEGLNNMDTIINSYMGRALCHSSLDEQDEYVDDLIAGSEVMHAMRQEGRAYDADTEAEINNLIARELTAMGRENEAEMYILRGMAIGLEESTGLEDLNHPDFE